MFLIFIYLYTYNNSEKFVVIITIDETLRISYIYYIYTILWGLNLKKKIVCCNLELKRCTIFVFIVI